MESLASPSPIPGIWRSSIPHIWGSGWKQSGADKKFPFFSTPRLWKNIPHIWQSPGNRSPYFPKNPHLRCVFHTFHPAYYYDELQILMIGKRNSFPLPPCFANTDDDGAVETWDAMPYGLGKSCAYFTVRFVVGFPLSLGRSQCEMVKQKSRFFTVIFVEDTLSDHLGQRSNATRAQHLLYLASVLDEGDFL